MGDVRVRLSTLWVFVMFNMLAADVISYLDGEFLGQLLAGYAGGVPITSTFLLLAAMLIEVPIAMIVLSRVLGDRWNRRANLAAAAFTAAFVIVGMSPSPHYIFFATIEVAAVTLIAWWAWTWRRSALVQAAAPA